MIGRTGLRNITFAIAVIRNMKTSKSSQKRGRVSVIEKSKPKIPLFGSKTKAEEEIEGLRRGRKGLESERTPDDTDARATLI